MPRTAFLTLLTLGLPLCTSPASVPQGEYEVEMKGLEGTWRVITITSDGTRRPVPQDRIWHLRVKQNRVELTKKRSRNFYRIDPGRKPAHIDLLADGTARAKSVAQGIYRLEGNTLTICWALKEGRPEAFDCKPGTFTVLAELVRVK